MAIRKYPQKSLTGIVALRKPVHAGRVATVLVKVAVIDAAAPDTIAIAGCGGAREQVFARSNTMGLWCL